MKKVAITIVFMLGIGQLASAQEKNPNKPERIKVVKIESNQNNLTSAQEEINNLQYQLDALDNKEALIRQNPEENRIATEQGWFEKTNKTRAIIKARIKELQNK